MKEILDMLLTIIAKQGPEYPEKNPYPTYLALLENGADPRKARLILITLLADIPQKAKDISKEELSEAIQKECCIKSKPADSLAALYTKLYSPARKNTWDNQREEGFRIFCKGTWKLEWEGEDTWQGDGVHMDCYASCSAECKVVDQARAHKAVETLLNENPFVDAEKIWEHISNMLSANLDEDLNGYVTGDDYYEPYMDDYWSNSCLEDSCEKLGIEIIEDSDSYDASSGDFEPDHDRYHRW